MVLFDLLVVCTEVIYVISNNVFWYGVQYVSCISVIDKCYFFFFFISAFRSIVYTTSLDYSERRLGRSVRSFSVT